MHHDTRALRLACPSGLLTTIRKVLEKAGAAREVMPPERITPPWASRCAHIPFSVERLRSS